MNCTPSPHHVVALCLYLVFSELLEYWLGKTKKIDASSKLEVLIICMGMVIGAMVYVYERLFKKGE